MSAAANASFCTDLVRARDFPVYAASLFVAPAPRRAWIALAAFNAEVAHVRDHVSQSLPGEIRLQWWRDVLTGEGTGSDREAVEGNPVAAELREVIAQYRLPIETLIHLIDAHVFDVYDDPMPDMAALEAHCRDTAGGLFALRAQVLGAVSPDVQRAADHAGIAEGLVDVMLALPRHAARRQLYLPRDLLNLHDVIAEEIFSQQANPSLTAVLAHLRREADRQLGAAWTMLDALPREQRGAFLPLVSVRRMLSRLETSEPFTPPALSRLGVLWTTWRAASAKPFKA